MGLQAQGLSHFLQAKKPLIIFGLYKLRKDVVGDADFINSIVGKLTKRFPLIQESWTGISFLQQAALDIGFVPGSGKLYF